MALASGDRLGVYEVRELIGAGGIGEVYRALDTKLNRDVALKIIPDIFASVSAFRAASSASQPLPPRRRAASSRRRRCRP